MSTNGYDSKGIDELLANRLEVVEAASARHDRGESRLESAVFRIEQALANAGQYAFETRELVRAIHAHLGVKP